MAVMSASFKKTGTSIKEALKDYIKREHVEAGFFAKDQYPDGTPVATVAQWNEYGDGKTPARPFMRQAVAKNSNKWLNDIKAILKATNGDTKKSLNILGLTMQSDIQDVISNGDFQENSELTNVLKNRFPSGDYTKEDFFKAAKDVKKGARAPNGKPLLWSRKMYKSVSYEVADD